MSADVVVVDAASIPVVVVDEDPVDVVVVDATPQIAIGVIVQSPPLTRLAVDTTLLAPAAAFVALISDTVTLTTETRIRVTTQLCGRASSGSADGHITALLTPSVGPTVQGLNAACFRAGTTSAQSAAVNNEFTGLTAGTYTVDLGWRVGTGAGIVCEPVSRPDSESAVLTFATLT